MQKLRLGQPVSEVLTNGFAYRPGLLSLINTAMTAREQATQTDQNFAALQQAIDAAEKTARQPVDKKSYAEAISSLRRQIRALRVPTARHRALNWYPRRSEW
jgi:mRNA degradation ribonuclease J1/J2